MLVFYLFFLLVLGSVSGSNERHVSNLNMSITNAQCGSSDCSEYYVMLCYSMIGGQTYTCLKSYDLKQKLPINVSTALSSSVELFPFSPKATIPRMLAINVTSYTTKENLMIYNSSNKGTIKGNTMHIIFKNNNKQISFGLNISSVCAQTYCSGFWCKCHTPILHVTRISPVIIGENVTLQCLVNNASKARFLSWLKGNKTINTQQVTKHSEGNMTSYVLTIEGVDDKDEGDYRCKAENGAGTNTSNPAHLVIKRPPEINVSSIDPLKEGQNVTIGCIIVPASGLTFLRWTKHTRSSNESLDLSNAAKYSGGTIKTPALTIYNVQIVDKANYTCAAGNKDIAGTSQYVELYVMQSPPEINVSSIDPLKEGQNVTIGCIIVPASGLTFLRWTKLTRALNESLDLSNAAKYSGGTIRSPSLTILNVQIEDEANYTCEAGNKDSFSTSQFVELSVIRPQSTVDTSIETTAFTTNMSITSKDSTSASTTTTETSSTTIKRTTIQLITSSTISSLITTLKPGTTTQEATTIGTNNASMIEQALKRKYIEKKWLYIVSALAVVESIAIVVIIVIFKCNKRRHDIPAKEEVRNSNHNVDLEYNKLNDSPPYNNRTFVNEIENERL